VPGEMIDGEVEKLLKEREDDLEKLIAISHVKRAAEEGVTRAKLEEMRDGIERDVRKFRELLEDSRTRPRPEAQLAAVGCS
jgi:hypothetical protein